MDRGEPDSDAAIAYARGRLADELPAWLTYHDLEHTEGLVVPAAERLADELGLPHRPRVLLRTAAWFHDLGFIERYEDNEELAVGYAAARLPGFGYGPDEVDEVIDIIWATRVPQVPTSPLGEVMCDADLFVLGTDRFLDREQALRDELAATGTTHDDITWNRFQLAFLEAHRYFTEPARRSNEATKAAHMRLLQERLVTAEAAAEAGAAGPDAADLAIGDRTAAQPEDADTDSRANRVGRAWT